MICSVFMTEREKERERVEIDFGGFEERERETPVLAAALVF